MRELVRDFKLHGEFSRGLTKLEAPFCETIIVYEVLGDQARIDISHEVTKVKSGQIIVSFHGKVTVWVMSLSRNMSFYVRDLASNRACNFVKEFVKDLNPHGEFSRGLTS